MEILSFLKNSQLYERATKIGENIMGNGGVANLIVMSHFTGDTVRHKMNWFCLNALLHRVRIPGYLDGTLHCDCGEFRHHEVHTLQARGSELENLLFDYCFESQVWGEETRSERGKGVRKPLCSGRRNRIRQI